MLVFAVVFLPVVLSLFVEMLIFLFPTVLISRGQNPFCLFCVSKRDSLSMLIIMMLLGWHSSMEQLKSGDVNSLAALICFHRLSCTPSCKYVLLVQRELNTKKNICFSHLMGEKDAYLGISRLFSRLLAVTGVDLHRLFYLLFTLIPPSVKWK